MVDEIVEEHHFINGNTNEVEIHRWTTMVRDGVPLPGRSKHVTVLEPGADLTGHSAKTIHVAKAMWTPEVLAQWARVIEKRKENHAHS